MSSASVQPTIKDIALRSGFSVATVSLALRRSPKIRAATAERVRTVAQALGYTPSPLVAALMARIRSARPAQDQTTLGMLELSTTGEEDRQPVFYREIFEGARARAEQLGFRTEVFRLKQRGMTPARLQSILINRGIHGALVPPYAGMAEKLPCDLSALSVVLIGYAVREPALHRVCPDQFQGILLALERLTRIGYRRIGLVTDSFTDRRVSHKWAAALHWHNAQPGVAHPVPVLIDNWEPDNARPLLAWVHRNRPDVILSPRPLHLEFIRKAGLKVPGDIGFCLLNLADQLEPVAGIDQRPREIGGAAVDALIAQLHRNERGSPPVPITISIEAEWVDGPTVGPPA